MNRFLLITNVLLLASAGYCQVKNDWQKKNLSGREAVNLSVVSDMYGYTRYFYPNPQNDKINWTKFLMYAIEKTEKSKNDDELLEMLEELFRPLLPDVLFKNDSLQAISNRKKESGSFYVRSHYHPTAGRSPRIRNYKKGAGNGAIQHIKFYENQFPVPDSMYCYQLKEGMYVFFPIAISEIPAKNEQCKQLIKEIENIDLRLMPGNPFANLLFRKEKLRPLIRAVPYFQKTSYRLANVVLLQHQIKHFYPYYFEDNLDKTWDSACSEALNNAATCNDQYEFFDVTRRLMAKVKDSHIFMNFTVPLGIVALNLPYLYPDAEFTFIGDSLYVKNIGKSLADKLEKWDRVALVNEEPFERWLASRLVMTSSSTHKSALSSKKLSKDIFSNVGDTTTIRLTLENLSGEVKNTEIPVNKGVPRFEQDYPYIAKEIENKIWHVNLCYSDKGKLTKYKDFAGYIPQLKNAEGIIFDVRGYPQYYTISVLSHLLDSVISVGHLRGSDYFFPNQQNTVYYKRDKDSVWYIAPATASNSKKFAKKYEYDKPKEVRLTCPVVFLTDANAISYGETFMEMVKSYQIGTIIGEPTAGTNGDVRFDFEVMMTGLKFTNHDDSQHHGIGIIPDIIVHPEIGKDNVLEYAKSFISEQY